MLHALAQVCHCAAQGKVGSGFDVCAAAFGSHRYCRFSPATIQPLLELADGAAHRVALEAGHEAALHARRGMGMPRRRAESAAQQIAALRRQPPLDREDRVRVRQERACVCFDDHSNVSMTSARPSTLLDPVAGLRDVCGWR